MSAARQKSVALELLCIWVLGALVHVQALSVGYMADDYDLVGAAASPSYGLLDAFPAGRGTYFRPLVMATLRIEHAIAAGPLVHHVANLALHLASASVLFVLAATLFAHRTRALVASLVFLLHPLVVTDVVWISGRTDSLATFFCLLSALALVRHGQTGRPSWAAASAAALLCALASKELAVASVFVLWPLSRLQKATERAPRRALVALGGLTATYVAYLLVRFYSDGRALPAPTARSLVRGVLAVPAALVWPNEGTALRDLAGARPALVVAGAAVVVGGVVAVLLRLRRTEPERRRRLLLLGAMTAAPLAPLLLTGVNASSRLMYLPLAIGCVGLAGVLDVVAPAQRRLLVGAALALTPMIIGASVHGRRWVESSDRTDVYCRDFQELRRTTSEGRTMLFVTSPDELEDVPLYSNDLGAALHYCARGTFGDLGVPSLMPVVLRRAVSSPVVSVRRAGPGRLAVSAAEGAVFRFDAMFVGATVVTPEATVTVSEIGGGGVRRFEVALGEVEGVEIVYFDGVHLLRVDAL